MKAPSPSPALGAHESIAGGLHLALQRITKIGGEALQIFTRNQRQWSAAPLTSEEIALFKQAWEKRRDLPVVSHASYLINLASADKALWERSLEALAAEVRRCRLLGIDTVVLHPGSHGGQGIDRGLARVIEGLDRVLGESDGRVRIVLETTAGQGTGLGSRFEELAVVLERATSKELLGVCVDTCHIFAAGYELRGPEGYAATINAMAATFGLDAIRLFHLNDSKTDLASRIDRHEHIGKGRIGLDGFRHLLDDCRFHDCPMILETPKDETLEQDRANLRILRTLLPGKPTVNHH
jgi:deoxyribonuclease-4